MFDNEESVVVNESCCGVLGGARVVLREGGGARRLLKPHLLRSSA